MPNASDIFNAINNVNNSVNTQIGATNTKLDQVNNKLDQANSKLDGIKASTDAVKSAVDQVNATLQSGFAQLIKLLQYADQALYQNALQNDTIICDLEKISRNTCEILNEAHLQTVLQTNMNKSVAALSAMYALIHAEVALTLEREQALRAQIEKCCPPEVPPAPCQYAPCEAPKPLGPPPQDDTRRPPK